MKPLPIKEQIKVLEELLQTWNIYGMCGCLYHILTRKYGMRFNEDVSIYIPSFTRSHYVAFYPTIKAIQLRNIRIYDYWDSDTIFGNLRRRWFIRHLIKELKKQL